MIGGDDAERRRVDRLARGIAVWSCGLGMACAHASETPRDGRTRAAASGSSAGDVSAAEAQPEAKVPPEVKAPAQTWTLEVEGFSPALVYTPRGSATLPLWFVAHGAGGTAEQQVEYWSRLLRDQYVIVALAGVPLSRKQPEQGHYYTDHLALGRELDEVIEKLGEAAQQGVPYAHRLGPPPFMFGGYSQGATMGALVLIERPEIFQRLLLIEGGYEGWTKSRAQRYQAGGGQRVLWVCGTASCLRRAESAAQAARHAGLTVQAEWVDGGGHAYWGRVEDRVTELLPWLL